MSPLHTNGLTNLTIANETRSAWAGLAQRLVFSHGTEAESIRGLARTSASGVIVNARWYKLERESFVKCCYWCQDHHPFVPISIGFSLDRYFPEMSMKWLGIDRTWAKISDKSWNVKQVLAYQGHRNTEDRVSPVKCAAAGRSAAKPPKKWSICALLRMVYEQAEYGEKYWGRSVEVLRLTCTQNLYKMRPSMTNKYSCFFLQVSLRVNISFVVHFSENCGRRERKQRNSEHQAEQLERCEI